MKVLTKWWKSIPNPEEKTTLSYELVAKLFSEKGIIKDKSNAFNYLKKKVVEKGTSNKGGIEFQDFQALFLRGIVKAMVTGIFKEVTQMYPNANGQKSDGRIKLKE